MEMNLNRDAVRAKNSQAKSERRRCVVCDSAVRALLDPGVNVMSSIVGKGGPKM